MTLKKWDLIFTDKANKKFKKLPQEIQKRILIKVAEIVPEKQDRSYDKSNTGVSALKELKHGLLSNKDKNLKENTNIDLVSIL